MLFSRDAFGALITSLCGFCTGALGQPRSGSESTRNCLLELHVKKKIPVSVTASVADAGKVFLSAVVAGKKGNLRSCGAENFRVVRVMAAWFSSRLLQNRRQQQKTEQRD